MNHELVILRGLGYFAHAARRLHRQCVAAALSSERDRSGAYNQTLKVAELAVKRDSFAYLLDVTKWALKNLEREKAKLLAEVYVRRKPKGEVAARYNVSLPTLYRRLAQARDSFSKKLQEAGCTEQWFSETYGCCPFVQKLLLRENGSRIEE